MRFPSPLRFLVPATAALALAIPQAAFAQATAAPTSGPAPLTVTFSPNSASGSYYQWQFNSTGGFSPDYSSEIGEPVIHTYSAPGSYTAILRIYDVLTGLPADQPFTITVLPPPAPPTASVTFTPYPAFPEQLITFTATAQASPGRSIAAYSWDLDNDGVEDSTSGAGPTSTATFSFNQSLVDRTVTVTAVDNGGLAGKATAVVMIGKPPEMKITGTISRLILPNATEAFTVTATGAASRPIQGYAWNFGDGTTGTSPGGGSASVSHTFSTAGLHNVTVTATDTAGHFKTVTIPVTVSAAPAALLTRNELVLLETTYTVLTLVPGGDSILGYHWDYTGTTADDIAYPATNTVTLTPMDSPKSTVTVTVDFQTADDITRTVPFEMDVPTGMVNTPIPISLTASADGAAVSSPVTIRVGHVVTFLASSSDDPRQLKEILWDFDGDGLRDRLDDLLPLNTTTVTDLPASYQYRNPGTFKALARVIGTNGNTGDATFDVIVVPGAAPLECFIAQPRDGQRVWGNHLSIQARTSPTVLTQKVEFRYRPSGSGPWTVIGTAVPPPYTDLSVSWDVTRLVPGTYEILAAATDTSTNTVFSDALQKIEIIVDPLAPDEEESLGEVLVRTHTIDPNVATRSEIAGDTAIEFPPHAFGMEYTTIRLERPFSNPHPLEARLQQLQFVPGSFRRLALDGGAGLQQPSKIALYDINPDGVLDGLGADKTKLRIYQFDDAKKQWVPLFGQVVQPGEDLARATLMSMGDVGLVMEPGPRAPSDASSDGCGLLGPELLILAILAARRRPRC
jgi:PKD repeat protein